MSIVEGPWEEGLLFAQSLQTEPARDRMKKFIELGGQTLEVDLELHERLKALGETEKGTEDIHVPNDRAAPDVFITSF